MCTIAVEAGNNIDYFAYVVNATEREKIYELFTWKILSIQISLIFDCLIISVRVTMLLMRAGISHHMLMFFFIHLTQCVKIAMHNESREFVWMIWFD